MAESLGWEFCFQQQVGKRDEALLYFQSEDITGCLEESHGDIHSQISELEFVLLQLLEKDVMQNLQYFAQMDSLAAQIDAHLSLAVAADTFQLLLKPKFSDSSQGLSLSSARDLLAEFQQGGFDPFDITLESRAAQVHLLASPESAGKTTYLHTLGSLAYLAQCGCPIAATEATLPLFDAFLTQMSLSEDKLMQRSLFYNSVAAIQSVLDTCE